MALRQRLLRDLAEIQDKPYPNIRVQTHEGKFQKACLILSPNGEALLHLTIEFPDAYPLKPPKISIQSHVSHPNVFGDYICASILNTTEGYTPAYTLKGICIQILSFFSSERLEQSYGGRTVDLRNFQTYGFGRVSGLRPVTCGHCLFDSSLHTPASSQPGPSMRAPLSDFIRKGRNTRWNWDEDFPHLQNAIVQAPTVEQLDLDSHTVSQVGRTGISDMPDEILSLICSFLEVEELAPFSQAWDRIGGVGGIVSDFNIIRNRELICFCLKKDFKEARLGVGVHVDRKGRLGSFESEFDLISSQAFSNFNIRRSVQGLPFEYWLPVPISRTHWKFVQESVPEHLRDLAVQANFPTECLALKIDVLYAFMNDIVVRLCSDAAQLESTPYTNLSGHGSSLLHASEKAIESYYHLYHLLLCLATAPGNVDIVRNVNRTIQSFLDGNTSKNHVPNLGYLLVMVLISDADMTVDLLMAIVRETITRNVVWVLDKRGANMPELAYMEANAISKYRLQKTFEASLTSYRLLMFLNLFRRTVNRGHRTLAQLRESLFDAHGAPPHGTAARLANDIKRLQRIDNFPDFLAIMGLQPPAASVFTGFLRKCVEASVKNGYSVWGITQERALALRKMKDPEVEERKEKDQKPEWKGRTTVDTSFFPNAGRNGAGDRGAGRGRGRGRGRGY